MDIMPFGVVVVIILVFASSLLTAAFLLRLIAKIFGFLSMGLALVLLIVFTVFYLLCESLLGFGFEQLLYHLSNNPGSTILALDAFDASLTLIGVISTIVEVCPKLPIISDQPISALVLGIGMFLFAAMGTLAIYSWYPETASSMLRLAEEAGFVSALILVGLIYSRS